MLGCVLSRVTCKLVSRPLLFLSMHVDIEQTSCTKNHQVVLTTMLLDDRHGVCACEFKYL